MSKEVDRAKQMMRLADIIDDIAVLVSIPELVDTTDFALKSSNQVHRAIEQHASSAD